MTIRWQPAHDPNNAAHFWPSGSSAVSSVMLLFRFYETVCFIYSHLNNAPPHSRITVSAMMILSPSALIFCLTLSLSARLPLLPAWAQLKLFPCFSAHGPRWHLFACTLPVRRLHYAHLLKTTLFDLTRFFFFLRGQAERIPTADPSAPHTPPFPPLSL